MSDEKDPFDGEYIGNIWGWRFTIYGAVFLLILLGLIIYRHVQLGVPFGMEPLEEEAGPADSLRSDTLDGR